MKDEPNEPGTPSGPRRVLDASEVQAAPLYPLTRVLTPEGVATEAALRAVQEDVRRATAEAVRIVEAAEQKAAAIERRAHEARERIEEAIRKEAAAETAERIAELVTALEAAEAERAGQHDEQVVETALALCRALVQTSIEIDEAILLELVEDTFASAAHDREMALVLHPLDFDLVGDPLDAVLQSHGRAGHVRMVLDDRLPRGSVRVETERGIHDGSLAGRLEGLEQRVRERMKEDRS